MFERIKKALKNSKGFTLIELIVVVAILGVLAGVATPNVISYVNESRKKADVTNGTLIGNTVAAIITMDNSMVPATEFKVLSETATGTLSNSQRVNNEIINKLQAVPKVQTDGNKSYYVAVDGNGKIIVTIGTSVADPSSIKVYPTNELN